MVKIYSAYNCYLLAAEKATNIVCILKVEVYFKQVLQIERQQSELKHKNALNKL